MPIRVLVTGHMGFIGKRLITRLDGLVRLMGFDIKNGHNVITTELIEDVDVIYHLAAQSSVEASWQDPVHDLDNIRMTARLVKEYPNAKIIYTASAATSETSPYGFSKWAAGEYIQNFHNDYVICMLPNVYGEKGGKSVVDIFKEQDEVVIYGDGKQTRSYVHVDDIVEGLILAKDWQKGLYALGNNEATTVLQLAEGKKIKFAPARKEAKESALPNTTPNWKNKISVFNYLNGKTTI